MFNGVKIGASLPKADLVYLGPTPPTFGKIQLIDFWSSTCEPCRTSIPKLNAFHQKYSQRGLVVVGVSEESKEVAAPFLEKFPMQYAVAVEGKLSLHKALRIRALPYAIFVSETGTIVWRGQPSQITEELIEALLVAPHSSRPAISASLARPEVLTR